MSDCGHEQQLSPWNANTPKILGLSSYLTEFNWVFKGNRNADKPEQDGKAMRLMGERGVCQ